MKSIARLAGCSTFKKIHLLVARPSQRTLASTMDQEQIVGIQQFIHPELPGISGVFKQRFSDFIVREITPSQDVVYLSSVDGKELERSIFAPKEKEEVAVSIEEETTPKSASEVATAIVEEMTAIFPDPSVITEEEKKKCHAFIEAHHSKSAEAPSEFLGFSTNDKTIRSQLHQIIRKHTGNFLETTSKPVDGNQNSKNNAFYLLITPKNRSAASNNNTNTSNTNNFSGRKKRKFDEWPKDCPDYLQFTVMKENIDTMNAVYVLSKQLKMKVDNIYFNGTKDKRGITTQKMTIYHRKPSDFNKINTFPFPPFIRCGDFQYVQQPCKLGQLAGNRFELVIRKIPLHITSEIANHTLSSIGKDGFINYFGLQRFGKGGCQSHIIGKYLLQSNWLQCVSSLFHPSAMDREDIRKGKEHYQNKDYQRAYEVLPSTLISERLVLQSLMKYPEDYMNAFHKISKNIRLIYLHAYQSYLWNKVSSERVKKYGINVIEGDLVVLTPNISLEDIPIEELAEEELVVDQVVREDKEGAEKVEDPTKMEVVHNEGSIKKSDKGINDNIHIVTKEDIEQNRFQISDVILPLIGSDILFPQNEFHAMYLDLLHADDLSLEIFQKCLVIYRLKGGYRKLMEYPKNLEWELKEYTQDNEEINITELRSFVTPVEKRKGKEGGEKEAVVETTEIASKVGEVKSEEVQVKKALLLKFSLSPGSYATMFLREVTKESTEFDYQTFLMNQK